MNCSRPRRCCFVHVKILLEFPNQGEAKAMWYEKVYLWVKFVERNILYPLLFLAAINDSVPVIKNKFGVPYVSPCTRFG